MAIINLSDKKTNLLVTLLSVVLLAIVVALYLGPNIAIEGIDLKMLPLINAFINGFTAITLIAGFFAIKNGNVILHQRIMTLALILSTLFLLVYVTYHASAPSTKFGGEGIIAYIYYFILLTHILLAIVIVPLVLISYIRAFSEKFDKHQKIARITLPLWLYVSITGVIVYVMISPYY